MIKNIVLILLSLTVAFVSCNEKSSQSDKVSQDLPAFVGMWNLEKMDLSGEIVQSELMGNPTYSFNGDNTYIIRSGGQSEVGEWSFKNNVISLISDKKKETELMVKDMNKDIFVYQVGNNSKTIVYLKREIF